MLICRRLMPCFSSLPTLKMKGEGFFCYCLLDFAERGFVFCLLLVLSFAFVLCTSFQWTLFLFPCCTFSGRASSPPHLFFCSFFRAILSMAGKKRFWSPAFFEHSFSECWKNAFECSSVIGAGVEPALLFFLSSFPVGLWGSSSGIPISCPQIKFSAGGFGGRGYLRKLPFFSAEKPPISGGYRRPDQNGGALPAP